MNTRLRLKLAATILAGAMSAAVADVVLVTWTSPDTVATDCGCLEVSEQRLRLSIHAVHPDPAGLITRLRLRVGARVFPLPDLMPARVVDTAYTFTELPAYPVPVIVEALDDSGPVGRSAFKVVDLVIPATLSPLEAEWRYLRTASAPPANWTAPDFDDSSWSAGIAPFGIAEPAHTILELGTKSLPIYFRRKFTVGSSFTSFQYLIFADAAAAVYENGEEHRRYNLPAGPLTPDTRASQPNDHFPPLGREDVIVVQQGDVVFPVPIRQGVNTLAVALYPSAQAGAAPWFEMQVQGKTRHSYCLCGDFLPVKHASLEDGALRIERRFLAPLMVATAPEGPWTPYQGLDRDDPIFYVQPTETAQYFR